jgi:MOSC domain
MGEHTERSTLAACVASIVGAAAADVPLDDDGLRAWLGTRGLGLVPVDSAAQFSWAGPWIAWRARSDGRGRAAAVMFGVPSGVVFDPAGTTDEILGGLLPAALDIALWSAGERGDPGTGVVEGIVLAAAAEAAVTTVPQARALAGRGLEGDRYELGDGTFASGRPGSDLTLIDAAVLDELAAVSGAQIDHRRNVVVRGVDVNALVGRTFRIGDVRCAGRRLCEPCAHLDRLNASDVLRPLVHRGGLRADILADGVVRVGDVVQAEDDAPDNEWRPG